MRNYVKWFERNVQWLAFGLGLLFLYCVVTFYIRHRPGVQLGDQLVLPGQVDSVIANGPIADLRDAMSRTDDPLRVSALNGERNWIATFNATVTRSAATFPAPTPQPPPPRPTPVLVRALSNLPPAQPISASLFRGVIRAPVGDWARFVEVGKDAISSRFRVAGTDLSRWVTATFKDISIPRKLAHTQVLEVIVTREQREPDGSWKSAGTVGSLAIHRLKDYPGDRAAPAAGFEYLQWATVNSEAIQRPAFYEVIEGTAPVLPVVAKAHVAQAQPLQKQHKLAEPIGDSIDFVDVPDYVEFCAHDEEVTPGQAYRYRLQYKLYNPLYQSVGLGIPEIANAFAVKSETSNATASVTVPPKEQFFVKALQNGRARFDLFVLDRQNKPVRQEIVAGPGDAIDGTGWTVVDIRDEHRGREPYVMLMNSLGRVVQRMRSLDQEDSAYKDLRDRI